jgi:hypothetical protein
LPIRWMAKSRFPDDYPANYRRPGWCRPCSPAWKRQSTRSSDLRAMLRTKLRSPVSFVRNTAELALRNRQIDPASSAGFRTDRGGVRKDQPPSERHADPCVGRCRQCSARLRTGGPGGGSQDRLSKGSFARGRTLAHARGVFRCRRFRHDVGPLLQPATRPVDTSGECREVYLRREPPRSRRQRLGETQS